MATTRIRKTLYATLWFGALALLFAIHNRPANAQQTDTAKKQILTPGTYDGFGETASRAFRYTVLIETVNGDSFTGKTEFMHGDQACRSTTNLSGRIIGNEVEMDAPHSIPSCGRQWRKMVQTGPNEFTGLLEGPSGNFKVTLTRRQ